MLLLRSSQSPKGVRGEYNIISVVQKHTVPVNSPLFGLLLTLPSMEAENMTQAKMGL